MNFNLFPVVNLILLGASASAILGILGLLRAIESRLGRLFSVFSFGIAFWIFCYGLEILFTSFSQKIFWANWQILSAAIASISFFLIALTYTGRGRSINPLVISLFSLIPLTTLAFAFTDEKHHLVRQFVGIAYVRQPLSFVSLEFEYGPLYWVNTVYLLLVVLAGVLLIARYVHRASPTMRVQGVTMMIGILLPWAANIITILGFNPLAPLDITVFALLITNVIFAVSIIRLRLFNLIPIARDTLIESLPDAVLIMDKHGLVVNANPSSLRLLHIEQKEILGKPAASLIPDDLTALLKQSSQEKKPICKEIQINGQGSPRYFNLTAAPLTGQGAIAAGWLVTLADITPVKESEQKIQLLLESEREQRILADTLRESSNILSTALNMESILDHLLGLVRRVVPYDYAHLFIVENNQARIVRQAGFEHLPPDVVYKISNHTLNVQTTENLQWMVNHRQPMIISNVAEFPGWINVSGDLDIHSWLGAPIFAQQELIGFISLISIQPDLYQQSHAERLFAFSGQAALAIQTARLFDELRRMAITDSLTSLFNRRHFFDLARLEFERARRYGEELSVIMLDIDHFKQVNDTYGHVAGDSVLATLARVCRADLREMDILARYGGEEFVILLPNTSIDAALVAAERLRKKTENTAIELNTTTRRESAGYTSNSALPSHLHVTISLGVSALDTSVPDLENLINRSDHALYDAKQSGRNCVCVWK